MNLSLLKLHLLNLDQKKIVTTPERYAWYKSHLIPAKKAPAPPPLPAPKITPTPSTPPPPPPPPQKQGFKLNPKKENMAPDPKSLLDQLKNSVEGVTFFEDPVVPKKREVVLVCTEEEKVEFGLMLEKLVQAIDQKICSCKLGSEGDLMIVSPNVDAKGILTLPPLKDLNDLAVKQQVWKEIKACLSKYC